MKKQKQKSGNDSKETEDESVDVIDKFSECKWVFSNQLKVFSTSFELTEFSFNLCENNEVKDPSSTAFTIVPFGIIEQHKHSQKSLFPWCTKKSATFSEKPT